MLVAVQGCSHGSLSAIYDSVHQFETNKSRKVDVLLLCGDFQALRSEFDFASLAVPPKYHALGTFHQYYSGQRAAPVLTIVIGGNHEASNYMWELYHGGWLAPNIYYLGRAGSVLVNGLRISGASGIYKDHDYNKGHFETVPYNNSTLRSAYHIRRYDVTRLLQLSPRDHSIFLSHDWPLTIPHYGDTGALLRRKPFFQKEVQTNTLGSPPLLDLLRHIQPGHWFSAHLHVKFAAVFAHGQGVLKDDVPAISTSEFAVAPEGNPDEIDLDMDEVEDLGVAATTGNPDEILIEDDEETGNPDEINIEDEDEEPASEPFTTETLEPKAEGTTEALKDLTETVGLDESADAVEKAREAGGPNAAEGIIGTSADTAQQTIETQDSVQGNGETGRVTKFLALDKCGPGKDFIQFLDITTPEPVIPDRPPRLTYDPQWLAITRALHPFLSLEHYQKHIPQPEDLSTIVQREERRIQSEGLLVPLEKEDGEVELVWEKGLIDVLRVQKFWPTAPAHGQPGGSKSAWYTNPQTEAFCGMLGIENKINPAPKAPVASEI